MSLVIIGTGLAGYNLAREWRKLNPDAPLSFDRGNTAVHAVAPLALMYAFRYAAHTSSAGSPVASTSGLAGAVTGIVVAP